MSILTDLICDRCRRSYASGNHGADRLPAHSLRHEARGLDWRVQVRGIAPNLRRQTGTSDFCPACVASWDAEDAAMRDAAEAHARAVDECPPEWKEIPTP